MKSMTEDLVSNSTIDIVNETNTTQELTVLNETKIILSVNIATYNWTCNKTTTIQGKFYSTSTSTLYSNGTAKTQDVLNVSSWDQPDSPNISWANTSVINSSSPLLDEEILSLTNITASYNRSSFNISEIIKSSTFIPYLNETIFYEQEDLEECQIQNLTYNYSRTQYLNKIFVINTNSATVYNTTSNLLNITSLPKAKRFQFVLGDYDESKQKATSFFLISGVPYYSLSQVDQTQNSSLELFYFNYPKPGFESLSYIPNGINPSLLNYQLSQFQITDFQADGSYAYFLDKLGLVTNVSFTTKTQQKILSATPIIPKLPTAKDLAFTLSVYTEQEYYHIFVQQNASIKEYIIPTEGQSQQQQYILNYTYTSNGYNSTIGVPSLIEKSRNYMTLIGNDRTATFYKNDYSVLTHNPVWKIIAKTSLIGNSLPGDNFLLLIDHTDLQIYQFSTPTMISNSQQTVSDPQGYILSTQGNNGEPTGACTLNFKYGVYQNDNTDFINTGQTQGRNIPIDSNQYTGEIMFQPTLQFYAPAIQYLITNQSDKISASDVSFSVHPFNIPQSQTPTSFPGFLIFPQLDPNMNNQNSFYVSDNLGYYFCQSGIYPSQVISPSCQKIQGHDQQMTINTIALGIDGQSYFFYIMNININININLYKLNQTQYSLVKTYQISGPYGNVVGPIWFSDWQILDVNERFIYAIVLDSVQQKWEIQELISTQTIISSDTMKEWVNITQATATRLITNNVYWPNLLAIELKEDYVVLVSIYGLQASYVASIKKTSPFPSNTYLYQSHLVIVYNDGTIQEYSLSNMFLPIPTKTYNSYQYKLAITDSDKQTTQVISDQSEFSNFLYVIGQFTPSQNDDTQDKRVEVVLLVYRVGVQSLQTLYAKIPLFNCNRTLTLSIKTIIRLSVSLKRPQIDVVTEYNVPDDLVDISIDDDDNNITFHKIISVFKDKKIQVVSQQTESQRILKESNDEVQNQYNIPCQFDLYAKSINGLQRLILSNVTCSLFNTQLQLIQNAQKIKDSNIQQINLQDDNSEINSDYDVSGWYDGSVLNYKVNNPPSNLTFRSNIYQTSAQTIFSNTADSLYDGNKTYVLQSNNLNLLNEDEQQNITISTLLAIDDGNLDCFRLVPIREKADGFPIIGILVICSQTNSGTNDVTIYKSDLSINQQSPPSINLPKVKQQDLGYAQYLNDTSWIIFQNQINVIQFYIVDWNNPQGPFKNFILTLTGLGGLLGEVQSSSRIINHFLFFKLNENQIQGFLTISSQYIYPLVITTDGNFNVSSEPSWYINLAGSLTDQKVFINAQTNPLQLDIYNYQIASDKSTVTAQAYLLTSNTPIYDLSITYSLTVNETLQSFTSLSVNRIYNNYGSLIPNTYFSGAMSDNKLVGKSGILRTHNYMSVNYRDPLNTNIFYPIIYALDQQEQGNGQLFSILGGYQVVTSGQSEFGLLSFIYKDGHEQLLSKQEDVVYNFIHFGTKINIQIKSQVPSTNANLATFLRNRHVLVAQSTTFSIVPFTLYQSIQQKDILEIGVEIVTKPDVIPPTPPEPEGLSGGIIAVIIVGSVIGVAGIGFFIWYMLKKKREQGAQGGVNYEQINEEPSAKSDR